MKFFIKRKTSTIKSKLLIIFFILATVPITIVGSFSYLQARKRIADLTTESAIRKTKQLSTDIQNIFKETETFLEIGKQETIKKILETQEASNSQKEALNAIFQAYRSTYKYNENILDIYIIGKNRKVISERRGVFFLEQSLFESNPIYNSLIQTPGKVQIISNYTSEYVSYENIANIVSYGNTILDEETKEINGVVVVDFDTSIIKTVCDREQIDESGRFYILNNKNIIVFNPPKEYVDHVSDYRWYKIFEKKTVSMIEKLNGVDYFIVSDTPDNLIAGWKIFGEVPLKEIMSDAYKIRNLTLTLVTISTLLSVVLFSFLTDKITEPIRNMKAQMKLVEKGNLSIKVHVTGDDELSDLGNSFNKMIKKIKDLLETSIKEHEQLKKAELNIMQAQINPHFLYNSLDAIIWMAEDNDKDKIIEMVMALSGFFRISLSKGAEIISIAKEIEHSKNYLIIQKMRYGELLSYSLNIDKDILNYSTLKIMLQPIIENAIYHGIKNKRNGGSIIINGFENITNEIVIEVKDTGIGIPVEKLSEISKRLSDNNELKNESYENGFGIFNVNERLKLYFGNQYGITIDSTYGVGTDVTIKIPIVR